LKWKEVRVFDFNSDLIPDTEGVLKILLPENFFFSLIAVVKDNDPKKFWKGIFKSGRLKPKLKEQETIYLLDRYSPKDKLQVIAVTRVLYIEKSQNLYFSFKKLYKNPCIRQVVKMREGLVVRFTEEEVEDAFLKELWAFAIKTGGVCPPATCSPKRCELMGGNYAPVVINKRLVC
jgi:hypothetical protein